MQPKYPIYVISKGRWGHRPTIKALEQMDADFRLVVEPQEYERYAAVVAPSKILQLPFGNLGQGGIPARNWVWEHSIAGGHQRHWILDDNIWAFYRLHNNRKIKFASPVVFRIAEDFADRYENLPMAGLQYESLAPRREKHPPVIFNTRIYSCILLSNQPAHRLMWRGRYNEDTDLSLRFLKAGYCTALLVALLANKQATMRASGGNTDELYRQDESFDGRLEMAKSLQIQHPDVTKITFKWGRWQHQVDYRPFKANKLIRKPGAEIHTQPNEYGMRLVKRSEPDQPNRGACKAEC